MAGGGYGKTTALRALAAGRTACWLGLTAADREAEALSAHIMQALEVGPRGRLPPAGQAIGASDRQALAEGQAALICESLDERQESLMLELDDVDLLSDEDSASQFLTALCLQAPTRLHIVLSGRRLPSLALGSVRGRGDLLEVTAADLAFTALETAALLVARLGAEAEPLAQACWSLTGGWAAALQLIADQLERLASSRWEETLRQLASRRGALWRDFAAELIDREPASARRILSAASVVPLIDPELLAGLEVSGAAAELDSLERRGLLVASGERGARTLSPVLSELVAERLPADEAQDLRRRAAGWLEQSGRLEEALECTLAGPTPETIALLRRCGRRLVAGGYGSRVSQLLGDVGTGGDVELDTIRGEAMVAVGDWDGAMELFSAIRQRTAGAPLEAAAAWRVGALLYLRGEIENAHEVLAAAYTDGAGGTDDALVSAWLGSTLWGLGELDESEKVAAVALRQAEASGDGAARAAAHVAVALAAASRGDRGRNERHHRLALKAAADAGDSAQLARGYANLSSKALEDGDYARTVREADNALSAGAGHNLFAALAMCNKAEALMHTGDLDEARALLTQAAEMFAGLGSLVAATPYTVLGALDAERGDVARARLSLERARRLAEQAGDVHSVVLALTVLARTIAPDDLEQARRLATEAAERATSLERAPALCAWSWVELCAGNRDTATKLASEAEAHARRTDDRPSVAKALELQGAAATPPDEDRLQAAVDLWRELGDPISTARAELALASARGELRSVERLREQLARAGVRPEIGVAGFLLAGHGRLAEIAITTLGSFAVLRDAQPIPLVAWQSRKARDLLKLLASRRGRPVTRDAAAEALWPGEDPSPLANRLSVALSTLRKVLDPERSHPPDHFIGADHQSLALSTDHVSLDVVGFLEAAQEGVALGSQGRWEAAQAKLRQAEGLYTGDFLEEDMYEDWAVDCREEARAAAQEVSRLLARAAMLRHDEEEATRHLRRLLERDPYDGDAWTALLGAQLRLRRYGEARRQHALYARRMAELAIPPVPLARTIDARV